MKLGAFFTVGGCALLGLVAACSSSEEEAAPRDPPTTLGADASSGGSSGTSGGSSGTSGESSGTSGSSGSTSGGCSGSAADPAAAATVSGYMDKLPSNAPSGPARAQIIDAIIKSCDVFGPKVATAPGWDRTYCWAHLVSAILKESGYNASASIKDDYGSRGTNAGKANDPTVGLLQIRFSSTVRDYVALGPAASLSCVGCTLPAGLAAHKNEEGDSGFWAVSGPTQNMSTMTDVACNVGLGAWYYYSNATSNGKQNEVTYLDAYCGGGGTAANVITGLRSHLAGPDGGKGVIANQGALNALQGSDNGAYQYITEIKSNFDKMVGSVSGTHPFFLKLSPSAKQYCQ